MDVRLIALFFLLGHLAAFYLTVVVFRRQLKILASRPDVTLRTGRRWLFILALGIALGNLGTILIDSLVIVGLIPRAQPTLPGLIYGSLNLYIMLSSAAALYALYVIAEQIFKDSQ